MWYLLLKDNMNQGRRNFQCSHYARDSTEIGFTRVSEPFSVRFIQLTRSLTN